MRGVEGRGNREKAEDCKGVEGNRSVGPGWEVRNGEGVAGGGGKDGGEGEEEVGLNREKRANGDWWRDAEARENWR